MADGSVIAKANTGTGTDAFAVDLIAGVNWPYSKLAFGEAGTSTAVSAAAPLPVDVGTVAVTGSFYPATQPVSGSVSVSNFPATQPVSGNVGVTGSVAVTGTFWQATQPVSGPLTDTQLRVTAVPVSLSNYATESTLASIVKAEDSAHVSGDNGIPLLGIRQISDVPTADADGDYTLVKIDEEGRVKVGAKPASFTLVTGNITANAQTVFCDVSRSSNVMFALVAASLVGHNATFEGSIDSTNGTDGNWFVIQVVRTNANTIETATGVLAATPTYAWEASVNGLSFVRVRATAHTSGTATWKFQRGSYATEPIPAAQISGTQPVSGTVTATVANATILPAVPATPYFLNSAATTNGALIITGTSGVSSIYATNTGAAVAFVKLYNKATAPTVGTDVPEMIIPVPAAVSGVPGVANIAAGVPPLRFALGLGIAITGGVADTDTTAVAAGQVKVKLSRTV